MSVSKDYILSGKVQVVVTRPGIADRNWRIEKTEPNANFPRPSWFVKLQTESGAWIYAGRLDTYTGQVGLTAKSVVPASDARLLTLNRILARVWAGDHQAYTQHGFDINAVGEEQSTDDGTRGALQYIADSFVVAIGRGLKRPMIRCHYKDQRFKLYLSGKGTVCLKSGYLATDSAVRTVEVDGKELYQFEDGSTSEQNTKYSHDPVGDEFYVGCLLRGTFLPAQLGRRNDTHREVRQLTATEAAFLDGLQADPAGFLAQCSKDMDRCCYCNQPLEDARSKKVGYGKTCASRWCLPWGEKKADEISRSFAQVHDSNAAGLCDAIRSNPEDETAWAIFSDWLEEKGLPRLQMPEREVAMPRS